MNSQYPHWKRPPLKDISYETKRQSNPDIIIETAPQPPENVYAAQYPYLPLNYPRVRDGLGTNLLKHIYEARPIETAPGWSTRRPSQLTVLRPKDGLYRDRGVVLDDPSYLVVVGAPNGEHPLPYESHRQVNLTSSRPQVRVREPRIFGPFWSPNPPEYERWEDMGLA
jgi:hypothetical protein